jgi:hypothetical protein
MTPGGHRRACQGPFPAAVYGRIDDVRGFCALQESAGGWEGDLREEVRWLALDWWGASLLGDRFGGALGHLASRTRPVVHVFRVFHLGGRQPIRAVASLPAGAYEEYGSDPFALARAGFFAFADAARADPNYGSCPAATGDPPEPDPVPAGVTVADLDAARQFVGGLLAGRSLLFPANGTDADRDRFLETLVWCLPVGQRARFAIATYTFADRAALERVRPALACFHQASSYPWTRPPPSPDATDPLAAEIVDGKWRRLAARDAPAPADPNAALAALTERVARLEAWAAAVRLEPFRPPADPDEPPPDRIPD